MKYIIVVWPESQMLMEQDWFQDECHLINDDKGIERYGSSAYFVPEDRIKSLETTLYLLTKERTDEI